MKLRLFTNFFFKSTAVVACIAYSPLHAAPFGIQSGAAIKSLKISRKISPILLEIVPPIPNSDFDRYFVVATPIHGVCQVIAYTPKSDSDDALITKQYMKLRRVLSGKYGLHQALVPDDPARIVHLRPAFLMEDADSEWRSSKRRRLPESLRSILLERKNLFTKEQKSISLVYSYNNLPDCLNWEPSQDRRGL